MARRIRKPPPPPRPEEQALHRRTLTLEQEEELKKTIAARVLQVRQELGLTQLEVGRAFGRSQPWAREVECARQWAPHYMLAGLARATGRSVGWFYGEEERPRRRT